jgi:hypothetical protein
MKVDKTLLGAGELGLPESAMNLHNNADFLAFLASQLHVRLQAILSTHHPKMPDSRCKGQMKEGWRRC